MNFLDVTFVPDGELPGTAEAMIEERAALNTYEAAPTRQGAAVQRFGAFSKDPVQFQPRAAAHVLERGSSAPALQQEQRQELSA